MPLNRCEEFGAERPPLNSAAEVVVVCRESNIAAWADIVLKIPSTSEACMISDLALS